ncbi:MAG: hypothetical protein PHT94_00595 [Candidatus Nanoarchaeia archaeon]|nr:hypothetical protein [Candidatus Nanoarchaeia archaeon]
MNIPILIIKYIRPWDEKYCSIRCKYWNMNSEKNPYCKLFGVILSSLDEDRCGERYFKCCKATENIEIQENEELSILFEEFIEPSSYNDKYCSHKCRHFSFNKNIPYCELFGKDINPKNQSYYGERIKECIDAANKKVLYNF